SLRSIAARRLRTTFFARRLFVCSSPQVLSPNIDSTSSGPAGARPLRTYLVAALTVQASLSFAQIVTRVWVRLRLFGVPPRGPRRTPARQAPSDGVEWCASP